MRREGESDNRRAAAGLLGAAIPRSRAGGHMGSMPRGRYAYLVLLLQLGAASSAKKYVPKTGADRGPIGMATGDISRRRDCHSAAPPSPFSRRFNRDDEGVPAN